MNKIFAFVLALAVPALAVGQTLTPFDAPTLQDDAHAIHLNPGNLVFLDGTHGSVAVSTTDETDRVNPQFSFAGGFGRIFGGGFSVDSLSGSVATTSAFSFGTEFFGFGVATQRYFSKSDSELNGFRNRTLGFSLRPVGSFGLGMTVSNLTTDRLNGSSLTSIYRPGFALRTNNGRFESDFSAAIPQGREHVDISAALRTRPVDGIRLFVSATARLDGDIGLQSVRGGIEFSLGHTSASFAAGQFDGSDGPLGYVATAEFHSPGLPTFRSQRMLRMDLAGDLAETSPWRLGRSRPTFVDTVAAIRTVAHDDRFDGLYLNMGGLSAGTAQLYELRQAIREVQAEGKQVIAFFESATLRDLYVAGGADVKIAAPTLSILTTGIGITRTFYGDLVRNLEIDAQFVRIAEYKSGPERYTHGEPTTESQEQVDALLDDIWGELVAGIAENLGISDGEAEQMLADGPLFANDLASAGYVDAVLYRDELAEQIGELAGREIELTNSVELSERDPFWHIPNRIAVLHINGAIVTGQSGDGLFGAQAGSQTLIENCAALASDGSIDGVIVRIDSPGGSAFASDRIHRALLQLAEAKPVVVSMGDVAASGGMYVAAFGEPIFATPNTVTGSIGIYAGTLGLDGMLDFIGVNRVRDERGGQSSLFDGRSWDEDDRAAVQAHIQNFYEMFLERVATSRNLSTEEVDEVGRGRLWSGARAVDVGLADSTTGFAGAYDALLEELELDHSDRVELVHYPRARLSVFALLPSMPAFRSQSSSDLERLAESLGANVALRWLAPWIWSEPGDAMAVTEWAFEGI